MSKLPEIRINFAYLLFWNESQLLAGKNKLKSFEQYEKWTTNYRREWQKYEIRIVEALQTALKVTFYRPVIDVECAPYFTPKSSPLIMNFLYEPNQFVDVLMHELCHVLLTDNNKRSSLDYTTKRHLNLLEEWGKLYGKEDFGTLVHIPVHALSKYIYLDVLKEPRRLARDQQNVKGFKNNHSYIDAWDYVNSHDYKQIITELKKLYERITT